MPGSLVSGKSEACRTSTSECFSHCRHLPHTFITSCPPSRPFPFIDLPPGIRMMIYDLLLLHDGSIAWRCPYLPDPSGWEFLDEPCQPAGLPGGSQDSSTLGRTMVFVHLRSSQGGGVLDPQGLLARAEKACISAVMSRHGPDHLNLLRRGKSMCTEELPTMPERYQS